jgi:hypothetical protein
MAPADSGCVCAGDGARMADKDEKDDGEDEAGGAWAKACVCI